MLEYKLTKDREDFRLGKEMLKDLASRGFRESCCEYSSGSCSSGGDKLWKEFSFLMPFPDRPGVYVRCALFFPNSEIDRQAFPNAMHTTLYIHSEKGKAVPSSLTEMIERYKLEKTEKE